MAMGDGQLTALWGVAIGRPCDIFHKSVALDKWPFYYRKSERGYGNRLHLASW